MVLEFSIAQVRDCVAFMDKFQQEQDADQATYRKIADGLPNNWGSTEVAIFTDGINQLSAKTDKMRQWLMDLHKTLGDASAQVESTGQDSRKKLNSVMSSMINK
jgi:hypothetical protein